MISFIRKIYEENSKIVFKFLLILIIVILTVVVSVRQKHVNTPTASSAFSRRLESF